jgi:hypothetical protein
MVVLKNFFSWIIEPSIPFVDINSIYDYLNGKLPEDYDNEQSWKFVEQTAAYKALVSCWRTGKTPSMAAAG